MTEPDHTPTRRRLPRRRVGLTHSVDIGGGAEVYLTTNGHEDRIGEVFVKWGKGGSTSAGLMDALSIMLSLALQYGVPPEVIVEKLKGMRFEPMGMTDDSDIPEVASVMDWLARRIALDYLPIEKRAALGVYSVDEEARTVTQASKALA